MSDDTTPKQHHLIASAFRRNGGDWSFENWVTDQAPILAYAERAKLMEGRDLSLEMVFLGHWPITPSEHAALREVIPG